MRVASTGVPAAIASETTLAPPSERSTGTRQTWLLAEQFGGRGRRGSSPEPAAPVDRPPSRRARQAGFDAGRQGATGEVRVRSARSAGTWARAATAAAAGPSPARRWASMQARNGVCRGAGAGRHGRSARWCAPCCAGPAAASVTPWRLQGDQGVGALQGRERRRRRPFEAADRRRCRRAARRCAAVGSRGGGDAQHARRRSSTACTATSTSHGFPVPGLRRSCTCAPSCRSRAAQRSAVDAVAGCVLPRGAGVTITTRRRCVRPASGGARARPSWSGHWPGGGFRPCPAGSGSRRSASGKRSSSRLAACPTAACRRR
jgi:hypothetical protein